MILECGAIGVGAVVLGGASIGGLRLAGVRPPSWLAPAHGLLGLGAVFLVFLGLILGERQASWGVWAGFGLTAGALVAGAVLFRGVFPKQRPVVLVAAHGAFGALGAGVLVAQLAPWINAAPN